jgi:hypothetical protein
MAVDISRFTGDGIGIKKQDTTVDKLILSTAKAGSKGTITNLDMSLYDKVIAVGSVSSTASGYFGITVDGTLWIEGKDTVSRAGQLVLQNNNNGTVTIYELDETTVWKEVSSTTITFYKEDYAGIGLHIFKL